MCKKPFSLALIIFMFVGLAVLASCSSSISSSSPRFTHVDVDSGLPFVFFDQDTKQVCWGIGEATNGSNVTVTLRVKPSNDPVEISIPVCKNLK